jgi:alpha-tubulin suppressor-like RCC1 family protein
MWSGASLRGQGNPTRQVEVAAGDSHGVLLKSDGTVWTWGSNAFGQLGRTDDDWWTPTRVPGLSEIRRIAAGSDFTIGLKGDGGVWTWGIYKYNASPNIAKNDSPVPKPIRGLPRIVAIAAGGNNAIALDSNGTVWCWGASYGPDPQPMKNLVHATAISAGDKHGIAIDADGHVWVWGDHGVWNLDGGASGPRQVGELSDIVAVAGGYERTIALKKDGTVWVGSHDGSFKSKPEMKSALSGVKAIAARNETALALNGDGTVWAWGDNHYRQLGNLAIQSESSPKPVRVGTLSGVTAIASGGSHSVAATGQGGVWTWGQNEAGFLGADPKDLERSDAPMRPGQPVPPKCVFGTPGDDDEQEELFSCSTASHKWIRICAEPDKQEPEKWNHVNYRFGPEYGPPEFIFPEHPESAPPSLFYSREKRNDGNIIDVIHFSNGAYTYRLYSWIDDLSVDKDLPHRAQGFGRVDVEAHGKRLTRIECVEVSPNVQDLSGLPCDPKASSGCR